MAVLTQLTLRNIKMFLRDKTSVFFSFLSMFIIIALYAFFLAQVNVNSVESMVGKGVSGVRFLVDSWIMAGIIVVNSITVTLGVFGLMVDDETKKRLSGFLVAPVKRGTLVISYLFSSWVVGAFLCILSFAAAELYIVSSGGELLPPLAMIKVVGLILLCVFSGSSMLFFFVSFVRSASGFSVLSTLIGTVIGFLTGIYMPIGILADSVQTIIKFVPASHMAVLMRQIFMEVPLAKVFEGAPAGTVTHFEEIYGITLKAGETTLSVPMMIAYIALSGLVFLSLSIYNMSRRKL